MESNSLKVFTALRYLVRWEKRVSSSFFSARNDARLRYHHASEALARSVDPAGRTGCPTARSIYPARWQPTPFRRERSKQGFRKSARLGRKVGKIDFWLACFPERLFGHAGIAIRCRPTPMAPELTRTTLCPAARRRTTVSTMAESVDRSGWCVVSCTIDDVPASRRGSKIVIIRGWNGQYVMSRKPRRKSGRSTPSLITMVRGFVRTMTGRKTILILMEIVLTRRMIGLRGKLPILASLPLSQTTEVTRTVFQVHFALIYHNDLQIVYSFKSTSRALGTRSYDVGCPTIWPNIV